MRYNVKAITQIKRGRYWEMQKSKDLHIIWTNDNPDTSRLMVMFYSTTSMAHKLWDNITVVIWGAPVKLVTENEMIQEEMRLAQFVGVKFSACVSCANQLADLEKLEALDVEVKPWIEPFTHLLQSGEALIYV
jgi:hypothetical protein